MTSGQIIVLATPVFLLLMALEFAWSVHQRRRSYRLNDAINSISLGMLSQISAVYTRLLRLGIYTGVYAWVAPWPSAPFWDSWAGWLTALVAAGASFFMLSDSLLATNKFVLPLPMAQFWVLGSYYGAQLLIVEGWMRGLASHAVVAHD